MEPAIFANETAEVASWPDSLLVAAVRGEPPNEAALDVLVERYWKQLCARCQMLTLSQEKTRDLAQEAWRRLLRTRAALKPDGNFPAYLTTIATNAWRDSQRSARRAGPMALDRLASLDAGFPGENGETIVLIDVLPDLNALDREDQIALRMDIDQALERLSPLLRDVLMGRYLAGESCAEIGRRYGRTEQTISAWVREAVKQMKTYFEEPSRCFAAKDE